MEKESLEPMLEALSAGRMADAKTIYMGPYTKHYRVVRDQVNKALDELVVDASAVHGQATADYVRTRALYLGISAAAMVLASFDISNTPMRSCHSSNLTGRKDAFVMRSAASVIYL